MFCIAIFSELLYIFSLLPCDVSHCGGDRERQTHMRGFVYLASCRVVQTRCALTLWVHVGRRRDCPDSRCVRCRAHLSRCLQETSNVLDTQTTSEFATLAVQVAITYTP
ncbi:hypothetical protein BC835DRAFT_939970 [Cytidiella melzeri]|nr:hypothetical protein BC835DRAFT_939970 [Cytidiella melzeri]